MPSAQLGRTVLIANPTSHSGRGAAAADVVSRFFEVYRTSTTSFETRTTTAVGDAFSIASHMDADTLIVLGGDGVIHEAVCGLMQLEPQSRPRLGVIPMGSGNDYARTIGMSLNKPDDAIAELLGGSERAIDVGRVTSDAELGTTYFLETLSFGLDAAIAIDTTVRRSAGTKQHGSGLFLTSSLKVFSRSHKPYACTVRINGDEPFELESLIFAVQNGPTYGGGFRICPTAVPNDGLLDVCYNSRKPNLVHTLVLLARARFGLHASSPYIHLRTAEHLQIDFAGVDVPCQVDGEELSGTSFDVGVVPQALRVIVPAKCPW